MDSKLREVQLVILHRFPTQADFAQAAGVDETIVSRVVRGRRKLTTEQAAQWAAVLNCKPKTLAAVTR
jgi:plasmid maintenance system antidote protein VapI